GAGKVHIRSWNGQITGGPVDVVPPGTTVTLPAGAIICNSLFFGTCFPATQGGTQAPVTLSVATAGTLPGPGGVAGSTCVEFAGPGQVMLPANTAVKLPGGATVTLMANAVVTSPAGTQTNPSLTPLAGGCADRYIGTPLNDPSTGQPYA